MCSTFFYKSVKTCENTLHFRGSGANGNRQMSCATEGRHSKGGEKRNHPTNKQKKRELCVRSYESARFPVTRGLRSKNKLQGAPLYVPLDLLYIFTLLYLYLHLLYLFVQAVI